MPDVVTMDKIVSLAKRRGFVFPSSEIYGGLGSAYDYGHYGVLLKENVKARWLEAMVRERDDIVALDSSIILHPAVWEASGHVAGFADPLVDCRFCKRRYRADHLDDAQCGQRPSKHPGETEQCDLTEPRQFNLMFSTRIGPVEETGQDAYLRPETAQGIFVNFKNVAQIARRQAAVRHRADRQGVPERDHAGELHLPHARVRADGDGVLRPAGRGAGLVRVLGRAARRVASAVRHPGEPPARAPARCRGAVALLVRRRSDLEYLHPIGWTELEGIAHRGDFDLTAHTQASGTKLEWVDGQERYTPHVVEPALGVNRSMLAFLVDAYDEEVVAERERTVLRLHPALAPVKVAVLPLIPRNEDMVGEGAVALRGASPRRRRRVRRLGPDRPPLPPAGRDRHAVRADDRRADARGRHGDDPRPRLARAGADPDVGGARLRARQARGGLETPKRRARAGRLAAAGARARARSAPRTRTCGRGRARRACGGTTSSSRAGPRRRRSARARRRGRDRGAPRGRRRRRGTTARARPRASRVNPTCSPSWYRPTTRAALSISAS